MKIGCWTLSRPDYGNFFGTKTRFYKNRSAPSRWRETSTGRSPTRSWRSSKKACARGRPASRPRSRSRPCPSATTACPTAAPTSFSSDPPPPSAVTTSPRPTDRRRNPAAMSARAKRASSSPSPRHGRRRSPRPGRKKGFGHEGLYSRLLPSPRRALRRRSYNPRTISASFCPGCALPPDSAGARRANREGAPEGAFQNAFRCLVLAQ